MPLRWFRFLVQLGWTIADNTAAAVANEGITGCGRMWSQFGASRQPRRIDIVLRDDFFAGVLMT